jgi:hypothetical protein
MQGLGGGARDTNLQQPGTTAQVCHSFSKKMKFIPLRYLKFKIYFENTYTWHVNRVEILGP